jgi:hypothetical protein
MHAWHRHYPFALRQVDKRTFEFVGGARLPLALPIAFAFPRPCDSFFYSNPFFKIIY